MSYLYLILSSLCSLIIAHLLKVTETKNLRTVNTLAVNYLVASIFALIVGSGDSGLIDISGLTAYISIFCTVIGAFFIGSFVIYSKSVHTNGVGITIASMRLSLLIPVLISVFLYAEYLGVFKLLGIVCVFGALFLLLPKTPSVSGKKMSASWLLLALFMLSGMADASLKIYNEEFSTFFSELTFMGVIFGAAFVIGLISCWVRKGPLITKKEAMMGAVIGLPNLYSAIFLIYALNGISGSVAYPVVNILNVIGGTLLGLLYWNDTVSRKQWAGIAIAVIAIILLL